MAKEGGRVFFVDKLQPPITISWPYECRSALPQWQLVDFVVQQWWWPLTIYIFSVYIYGEREKERERERESAIIWICWLIPPSTQYITDEDWVSCYEILWWLTMLAKSTIKVWVESSRVVGSSFMGMWSPFFLNEWNAFYYVI